MSAAGRRSGDPLDYPRDQSMVPHGMAVALTAPEAFHPLTPAPVIKNPS